MFIYLQTCAPTTYLPVYLCFIFRHMRTPHECKSNTDKVHSISRKKKNSRWVHIQSLISCTIWSNRPTFPTLQLKLRFFFFKLRIIFGSSGQIELFEACLRNENLDLLKFKLLFHRLCSIFMTFAFILSLFINSTSFYYHLANDICFDELVPHTPLIYLTITMHISNSVARLCQMFNLGNKFNQPFSLNQG